MGFIGLVYTAIYYLGLEFIAFVLVDVIVKAPLRDAANEQEKRTIWLYESAGLGLICLLLYTFHHMPYLLLLLTCVTFTCTQLFGRNDITRLITSLRAQWENHLQHEENMKQIERQKQQQQHLQQQALGMAGLNNSSMAELNLNRPNQHGGFTFGIPYFGKQGSLHYPPNATVVPGQDRPTYSVSPTSVSYHNAVKQGKVMMGFDTSGRNWNNLSGGIDSNFSRSDIQPQLNSGSLIGMGRSTTDSGHNSLPGVDPSDSKPLWSNNNLQRRSLHSDSGNSSKFFPRPFPSSSSIKSKFLNVIGFGTSVPKPVGLVNNGQNMCFINSVVQCLSRGPFIVECLTADAAKELECTVAESELLSSLAELLDIVTVDPNCSDYKVFNAARFRKAASILNPVLVSPPHEPMRQQDAAEFLMWLLETLHGILNKNSQALQCVPDEKFSSPRLAQLKLIYGDLNGQRIRDLKDQCRREIAVANGLENESYAEAIQRLSDLEWLTHKQDNDTVVDGLFTGQLVEAYHSVDHGHISVNLQAFNVLPVPIAAPRYSSGLVMVEDCFTSFCNIENLTEVPATTAKAGIATQTAQPLVNISKAHMRYNAGVKSGIGSTPLTHRTVRSIQQQNYAHSSTSLGQQMAFPSPIASSNSSPVMLSGAISNLPQSPIIPSLSQQHLVNDSGFHDNAFRTSTPITTSSLMENRAIPQQPKLQRRCLLRQLPECLIIQLMRFRYDQATKTSTKINTPVSIRLRGFNLRDVIYDTVTQRSDLTSQNGGYVYELYGICLHIGASSTAHGHYISYCLDGDKWYRMDDQSVEEVNMEYQLSTEEIRQNAYLLFYRKMGSDNV